MIALKSPLSTQRLGALLILLYALGIAFKGTFAKFAYAEGASVLAVLLWRSVLSLPFFWLYAIYTRRGTRAPAYAPRQLGVAALLGGGLFYLSTFADYSGLALIPVSVERLILFTYPIFVVLFTALWKKRLPTRGEILALVMVQIGMMVVMDIANPHAQHSDTWGELYVLAAAVLFALYILCTQHYSAILGNALFIPAAMTVSTLAVVAHFGLAASLTEAWITPKALWMMVGMVVFSTVLPIIFFAEGIRHIGGSRASLLAATSPVITLVAASALLGETLQNHQLFGGAIIICGVLLQEWTARRTQTSSALEGEQP